MRSVFEVKTWSYFLSLRLGRYSTVNSLFAKYKFLVCHIILGHTGIGATFRSTMFNSLYLFTYKSYGEFQKARLIMHADSANRKQW